MSRVVHFEIPADDPQRAAAFYKKAFGWKIEKWPGQMEYWMVITGPDGTPGINGGLLPRRGELDGQAMIAYVCTVDVESIAAAIASAELNGGNVVVPKMAVPGVGWLVYCKDTEGNIFGMLQADPGA